MGVRSLARRVRARSERGGVAAAPAPTQPATDSALSPHEQRILAEVRSFTMVSTERLLANMDAVAHAVRRGIPGAVVECGVWRGGSVLAMIRTLQSLGVDDRDIYLYDTFEGMTQPGELDTSPFEQPARVTWDATPDGTTPWSWAFDAAIYDLGFVTRLITATGYPPERLHFVQGPVEQTLPGTAPDEIAVLRLDTDWYASTRHELEHLYPRICAGGVLIVDDFGHWEGARRAVEEYFSTAAPPMLLSRIDYSGRMGVKH